MVKSEKNPAPKKKKADPVIWLTIDQAAAILKLKPGSFKHDYRPAIPKGKAHQKKEGVRVFFNAASVVEAYTERKLSERRVERRNRPPDGDPLLDGGQAWGSPALERYRDEKAKSAKLDRLERERELVPRLEIRQGLSRMAQILRTASGMLERECGERAYAIITEALKSFIQEVNRAPEFSAGRNSPDNGEVIS